MMKSSEIRQAFLDYFEKNSHKVVSSSSLVPGNDATLLFTNAGMVQFKDLFLGHEQRNYVRAVTSQRCVRAGGKHNDLENVGYTARHHTFFEMLGNFSFGDYFKHEAIRFAWDFLTNVLKLPSSRLWISVHNDDDESFNIWHQEIGVPKDKISRCGDDDNFWSMGDTGPCGPCTEVFYDHGPEIAGGPPGSIDADGDRYIEIWNMVFMQYNRDEQGVLNKLPKPSVDTGMGLERITAVVQGVHNNYEIDTFQKLINAILQFKPDLNKDHPSLKVIADHIRACSFLIADGVTPSNEGRGYVLRRIMRRAIRHGHKLDLPMPFFYKLVPALVNVMGEAYPLIVSQEDYITKIIKQEEEQFARTIDQGIRLLQDRINNLTNSKEISGQIAFQLYDTFGFPLDLTCDIAREHGLTVDVNAFTTFMENQRAQSQAASQFSSSISLEIPADNFTNFHGYECDNCISEIKYIFKNSEKVNRLNTDEQVVIVLDSTPFYAESGGQIGDVGRIYNDKVEFIVEDTKSQGNTILHYGKLVRGELEIGQKLNAEINSIKRADIRINHSATHLLHAALKKVLGPHVQQKGSLVAHDRARFDFSNDKAMTFEELQKAEEIVNAKIRENLSIETKVMDLDTAKQSGAVALFGEKYGDSVRVLEMGDFSKELCGGTHAKRTGDIGILKIIGEYGVASGVRRIEFVTGKHALEWINNELTKIRDIAGILKTQPNNVISRVEHVVNTIKAKDKEILQLQQNLMQKSTDNFASDGKKIGDISYIIKRLDNLDAQGLRAMLDNLKSKLEKAVIVLYAISNDKINVIAGISKSIVQQVPPAGDFVKLLCGRGGGRPDMAQGGGLLPDDLEERIAKLEEMLF